MLCKTCGKDHIPIINERASDLTHMVVKLIIPTLFSIHRQIQVPDKLPYWGIPGEQPFELIQQGEHGSTHRCVGRTRCDEKGYQSL